MAITKIQSESMNLADTYAFTGTVTGAGGNNKPAFCAVKSSQTTGQGDNVWTKITYDTEKLDSDGKFASDKFTPTVAGEYFIQVNACGGTSNNSSVTNMSITIYKNGSEDTTFTNTHKPENEVEVLHISTSGIINLDADDYVEAYIKINKSIGTNRVTSSQFMGFKIIE